LSKIRSEPLLERPKTALSYHYLTVLAFTTQFSALDCTQFLDQIKQIRLTALTFFQGRPCLF